MKKETKNIKLERPAEYWGDILIEEFSKESDRAAVILAGSLLDNALAMLLKSHLVPTTGDRDELLDNDGDSPLSTFSSRIKISYRLGLISSRFARDLNLIRKIRNDFSHEIKDCSFKNTAAKDRVQ